MRKSRFTSASLLFALFFAAIAAAQQPAISVDGVPSGQFIGYVQDEIVVELTAQGAQAASQGGPSANALARMPEFAQASAQSQMTGSQRQFPNVAPNAAEPADQRLARMHKIQFRGNLDAAISAFSNHPLVARAEPIGIHAVSATPNDTYYDDPPQAFPYDQWHYRAAFGVNAAAAWDTETGDPSVVVAVLDSGVRYWHTDLGGPNAQWAPNSPKTNGNIWVNPLETPGNGVDDDVNGFVDDTIGYDFVATTNDAGQTCIDADCSGIDNNPSDWNGHGTHVAGTIAAITNNARSVAGVAGGFSNGTTAGAGNGVKILPLRIGWHANYLGQVTGIVRMDYAAQAMQYVAGLVDDGVNVTAINCSWGSSNSGGIDAAVNALLARDVMIMHAAGNSNANSPGYLGDKAGVMNVGATDVNGNVASFSNFGTWVDLAAPGVDIISTYHNPSDPSADYVAVLDGTSMSSPHAAGVAALLESFNPALTGPDKFALMVDTAIPYSGTKDVGSGIVNAYAALLAAPSSCSVTADFDADTTSLCGAGTVNFTNLSTGPATGYSWDFGDGGSSTAVNPSHAYVAPGTYTVALTVSSAGCADSETKVGYITVGGAPTADFDANPISGNAPLNVHFTDQSSGSPTAWSWDFGDGGSSVLQHPSHVYSEPGVYTVSLMATNSCGNDSTTQVDLVVVDEAPTSARIYASSDLQVEGQVLGSYQQTFASDNNRQSITEVSTGGNPARRRSSLEHRWTFSIPAAAPAAALTVEASRTNNSEGDNFRFEYSPNGTSFVPLLTVASSTEQVYTADMPDVPAGTVYIRVVDTDNTQGRSAADTVSIDEMYIETSQTVNNAPTVSITSPSDGDSFASGANVALAASANDTEEGNLSAAIEWTSSIDGFLGTGANLNVALSDGAHTITADVQDSTGLSGSDSVAITVGTPGELVVVVITDQPSYPDRSTVLISVVVSDGVNLLPGANVAVEVLTPKGRTLTGSNTTDALGSALFSLTINAKRDGYGTYLVNVTATAPGFNPGAASTTFEVF